MDTRTEQAFSSAQEASKQVLTLATGLIAITVALLGNLKSAVQSSALVYLHSAWICAGVSVLFGIVTLMLLTGQLGRGEQFAPEAIYSRPIMVAFLGQFGLFVAALGLTITFGVAGT
jgi:hypothetical protein